MNTSKLLAIILFALSIPSACSLTRSVPAPGPSPAAISTKSLPAPMSPGEMVIHDDLEMVMSEAEITTSYINEYGSTRGPRAGEKFLWIRIYLNNTGQRELRLPETKHFSTLYGATEFKPRYGHRARYPDYTALPKTMPMGQEVDAWLRFDIPAVAELTDLWFAFLPESSQISVSFSVTEYPWADHPIYLWNCAP